MPALHRLKVAAAVYVALGLASQGCAGLSAGGAGAARGLGGGPQGSADLYRRVQRATVLVRAPHGVGAGVIIDPSGWILTNAHVVVSARGLGGQWADIAVELARVSSHDTLERSGVVHRAALYRVDEALDLALLRIERVPDDLPWVPLASTDPSPGDPVTCVGHAAMGLLWAAKSCHVSAVGSLAHDSVQGAMLDGPALGPGEFVGASEGAARGRHGAEEDDPSDHRVVQSTCVSGPGDSGGPLVDNAGALVGLNSFMRCAPDRPSCVAFHVHVDEFRGWLTDPPARPLRESSGAATDQGKDESGARPERAGGPAGPSRWARERRGSKLLNGGR